MRLVPILACLTLATACDDLERIPSGTCGNLVVESGEQCDGEANCAAVCRFTCNRETEGCPGELACGVDGVCVASTNRFVPYELAPRLEMPTERLIVGDLDGDLLDDLIGVGESLRVRFGSLEDSLQASYEKRIRPPTGPAAIGQLDGAPGLDVVFPTADGVFTLVARGRELDAIPYASAQSLPDDGSRSCTPSPGWASCRTADLNRDGLIDRVGFVTNRDNVELELGRAAGAPVAVTLDTVDVITDLTTGDFDGDAYGDIAFSTRSANGLGTDAVHVVYGAPQADSFVTTLLLSTTGVTGIAAANIDASADGIDDLGVERSSAVAVYLGDSSRDLSAPFRLDGGRSNPDVPYALVAGEFVGGQDSGIDVMVYARNPAQPANAYLWWLRGLGAAQLTVGAIDEVEATRFDVAAGEWKVADLVSDLSTTANGPDEVIGLAEVAAACAGPALTAAVPSARFTTADLLRSVCLGVDGEGWQPSRLELVGLPRSRRAVALAQRGATWWIGQADRLDDPALQSGLRGSELELPASCRDPLVWQQTPALDTVASWVCDDELGSLIVEVRAHTDGTFATTTLAHVPPGATHFAGDFNGDGLTDLAIRQQREVAVLLQCSEDMVGTTPGC